MSSGNGSTNSTGHNSNGTTTPPSTPTDSIVQVLPGFLLGKLLGTGSYGQVRLATNITTGIEVAVKLMDKGLLKPEQIDRIHEEYNTMKQMNHPHIVKAVELVETEQYLILVMQYCRGGDLLELIKQRRRLREERAKNLFFQLISAMEHAHLTGYIHRDLKAENLFLLDNSAHHLVVGDWGFAGKWEVAKVLTASFGSLHYAAPEICGGKEYTGPEVDLWSCGVILYAMVCGALPFSGSDEWNVYQKIVAADYHMPSHVSEDCASLIRILLVPSRERRATMLDVKKHPFLLPKMDLPSSPKERSLLMSPRARIIAGNNQEELGSPRLTPNASPRIDSPRFTDEGDSQLDRKISRYQSPGGRKQFSITNLLSRLIWKRSNKEEELEKESNEKEKEKEKSPDSTPVPTKVSRRNSNAAIISPLTSPEKEKRVRSISFTRKKSLSRGSLYDNNS